MKFNWLFSCQLAETRHILYSLCFGDEHCKHLFPIIGPTLLGDLGLGSCTQEVEQARYKSC